MTKPTFLLVDDSRTIRSTLVRQLAPLGAAMLQAENGQAGLEMAREQRPDLIITDLDMPVMDGFALCKAVKNDPDLRHIPVLILSANEQDEYIARGFSIGAAAYVTKIRAREELLPRVQALLERVDLVRNRRVLVVDDSRYVRKILTDALEQEGFLVDVAKDGREALGILERDRPDLIITDVVMPKMDGRALCETIRSCSHLDGVPILVMSSESDRRLMREMIQIGASGFIVKPFNVDQMLISVEKLLSDHVRLLVHEKQRLAREREILVGSITSLVHALEARDPYTRGHSESVAAISGEMGRMLGFSATELEQLILCAKLHDIGKIGIRDDVLLKPGRLTDQEFALIQEHPAKGADILMPIPSMAEIIPGVLQHHEKLDGSGYPLGLSGKTFIFSPGSSPWPTCFTP